MSMPPRPPMPSLRPPAPPPGGIMGGNPFAGRMPDVGGGPMPPPKGPPTRPAPARRRPAAKKAGPTQAAGAKKAAPKPKARKK